ncbi:MAG: fatty acid desaturase [Burkholderiales bacterium]
MSAATLKETFYRYEGPTWAVAGVIYGGWAALIWWHAHLPWWVITPLGAYLVAWHFSLQHEAIHSFRSVPDWLRWAVVLLPLGLWLPFPLYYRAHRKHHQNTHLTEPGVDTESFYVRQADWQRMSPAMKAILVTNQTLAGRVIVGPMLRLARLAKRETLMVARGDFSHLPHWALHVVLVAGLFGYISGVCGMPWWQYVAGIAWPAFGLGWVRSFIEHRYGVRPGERTGIIESNAFWSLLFLNNNLHAAHHLHPKMPWFRIPGFYREHRAKLLAHCGNYVFPSYGAIARRWLFRPAFLPHHPRW